MRFPRFALGSAAATLLAAASASRAEAKEWLTLPIAPTPPAGMTGVAAATSFLDGARTALSLDGIDLAPRVDLTVRSSSPDRAPRTVHFEQRYGGLRVVDRSIAVRMVGDRPSAVSLDVARDLTVSITPDIDESLAGDIASVAKGTPLAVEKSELAILGRDGGILVWILDARDDRGGERWLVDAHTGEIVVHGPLAVDAKGRVYAISSVVTPTPMDVDLLTLDTTSNPVHLDGWNGLLTVTNYQSGSEQQGYTLTQTLLPNTAANDFLYDPPVDPLDATDAFAQVNLFYHLTSMRDYYAGLGIDETPAKWKLTAAANVLEGGQPLDNAFYSPMGQSGTFPAPNLIAIGQGSQNDFAYDSDVFKHEFGHYVTFNTVNYDEGGLFINEYGLSPFGGGIDEGSADYFACSDNQDPILGEASLGPLGAERDLTDVHKHCPDDVFGESHADGEIIGSLGWTIRTHLGQSKADRVFWGGISLLTKGPSFGELGKGLIQSANDLVQSGDLTQAEADTVAADVAARGLDDCDEVLPLKDGQTRTVSAIGLSLLGQFFGADCQQLQMADFAMQSIFHFSRATATTDTALRLHVVAEPDMPADIAYTVFVRADQHVGFNNGGGGLPSPNKFDAKFEFTTTTADLVLDATTMPAFQAGKTYYFAVTHTSCPSLKLSLSADANMNTSTSESSSAASTGTGTGQGGAGGSPSGDVEIVGGGGCNCTIEGGADSSSTAGALAIGGLALAYTRRRRRR